MLATSYRMHLRPVRVVFHLQSFYSVNIICGGRDMCLLYKKHAATHLVEKVVLLQSVVCALCQARSCILPKSKQISLLSVCVCVQWHTDPVN